MLNFALKSKRIGGRVHVAFILGLKFARRINRDVINGDSAARGGDKVSFDQPYQFI